MPLLGGDVTEGVVRIGDTVRRPPSRSSPMIARLLRHLQEVGFDGAPRHLGTDRQGRDVLTFVAGQTAIRPWPEWVADEAPIASVARLVRAYDDAAVRLGLPDGATSLRPPDPDGTPPSMAGPPSLLGHLDITPENVVFRDGEAAALIDFDLIRPATRAEEVSNVLPWWAPWMPPADREAVLRDADAAVRGAVIVEAYGLNTDDRAGLVDLSINLSRRSWFLMKGRADHLGGGWQRMWDEGIGDRIRRPRTWLIDHRAELLAALR